MTSPVDNLQRRLASTDLSQSYWVEAGAGTGKTTILIERLLNLIIQGKAGLDEIVAITFTEKAAAELKHRLREELEQKYRQLSGDKDGLLQAALEEIEYASITTIHSFATGLLKERPVEAGLDPRFIILDSGEMQDLLEETWKSWFLDELASEPPILKKALYLGCTPSQLKELALILYRERDLVQEGCCPEPPVTGLFAGQLTEALFELKQLLPCCRDLEDRGAQHIQEIATAANEWLAIDDPLEQERYLLHRFPDISQRGNQKNWSPAESCRRQKAICRQLREHLNEARRQVAGKLVSGLVSWAGKFTAAVEQAKQEKSALDFQDLLLKSRNLLRDNLAVRAYFQQRYRYLLVDEFQDTDPLQVEIIFFLAEKQPRARCWQEAIPVPGKLFIVGDPKQSIYRFRRADIEIYQEAKQIMGKYGRLIDIIQNFRTLPPVINWVNSVFDKLIIPRESYQPRYQPLFPYRPGQEEPAVIVLTPPPAIEQYRAAQVRAAEAEALAGLIDRAVGRWTVIDKCGSARPLRYGDCALLFSTTVGLEHYQEALRRMQIPYRLEGGKKFFHQAEIAALKNLLRAIDNPYDQISVFSVFRDWGGLSDQQIFEHTASGGTLNYLSFPGPASTPVEDILALLAEMHRRR
ncbi:MAG TPA: UvrD-helicase domain-containing protein, partial [Firmicutes bacterium]|nr:UvrD-helicase domain-containing protein [Bacillota bacterium]